jgi:epoxyqueuosine reductase QueG
MTAAGTSAWVIELIEALWADKGNDMRLAEPERAWDPPLIGFANGADALWTQYKTVVDPGHWTPVEAWRLAYPDVDVAPEELTVISWILPQTEATKRDQREQTLYPAERWARTRVYGEQANHRLRCDVAQALTDAGYHAVAPMASPQWSTRDSEKYVYTSNWSERHAAYAAGLGTFGLCDGLITPVGKAMRAGSVVARIPIPASPRPYTDHHAYCLFYARGTCGECIDRCPVGAISAEGHDKRVCEAHLTRSRAYVAATYGFDGYGCGLCQVGVPCESRVPEGIGD